ncbi:G-patch domain-containing protein [Cryptosporidium felis]|nr:G-patch domain-containing protein [Cryptosporidium felis]
MKDSKDPEELRAKYGKGFDLIKKLGFKGGGLGVDGGGIAEPIEVKARSGNIGIAARGYSVSKKVEESSHDFGEKNSDVSKKKPKVDLLNENAGEKTQESFEPSSGHIHLRKPYMDDVLEDISTQRDKVAQKRKQLQTALHEKEFDIQNRDDLISQLREKKSIMESLTLTTKSLQRIFLKLQYDVDLLLEDEILTLFPEEQRPSRSKSDEYEQDRMERLEIIVSEFLGNCESIFESCKDSSSRKISRSYLPYCSIVGNILRAPLQKIYESDWEVGIDPDFGISAWVTIKSLFVALQTPRKEKEYDSKHCFEQLISDTAGKCLETYYRCLWDPVGENEYGLSLLRIWLQLIPIEFVRAKLIQVIWKKQIHQLQHEEGDKGLFGSSQKIKYKWLFLWLSFYYEQGMGGEISRVISKHIDRALEEWEPPEEWPISLLNTWKPILESKRNQNSGWPENEIFTLGYFPGDDLQNEEFPKKDIDRIITTKIVPKLLSFLRKHFQVQLDHEAQDMDCIFYLELWFKKELLEKSLVSQIFVQEIGPKWLKTLEWKLSGIRAEYRNASTNHSVELFRDLLEWYMFWREIFSSGALASAKSKAFLTEGLVFIDFHVNNYSDLDPEKKDSTKKWLDYELSEETGRDFMQDDQRDDTLVFSVLEWIATETGLVIKQSSRTEDHGRQVYSVEYSEFAFQSNLERSHKIQSKHFKVNPTKVKMLFYIRQGVIFTRDLSLNNKLSADSHSWSPESLKGFLTKLGIEEASSTRSS